VYTNHPFSASLQVNWTFLKKYFKKYALPFNFFERKDNSFAVNFIRRKKEVQRKKQKKGTYNNNSARTHGEKPPKRARPYSTTNNN
jgi:hypothetical protein